MGSKGSDKTTTTSSPNPVAMSSYYDVLARAQNAANKPYQGWGGPFTAGPNQYQTGAAENVSDIWGQSQPYFTQAGEMAGVAGAPTTAEDISRWYNPAIEDVINATQRQFDERRGRALTADESKAAALGALGGNRVGVQQTLTEGELARENNATIAGLYSGMYDRATQAAQAEKQRQGQIAGTLAGIGSGYAGTGANIGQTQFGLGEGLRGIDQSDINARMQEHFRKQGYDFQTAQWLASITGSMGSLMGGTSETQGPQPNPWTQAAGLGLTALSFINTGGRVNKAPGGEVSGVMAVPSYVPTNLQLTMGKGAPEPPKAPEAKKSNNSGMAKGLAAIGNKVSDWMNAPGDPMDLTAPNQGPSSGVGGVDMGGNLGDFYAPGGGVGITGMDPVGPMQSPGPQVSQPPDARPTAVLSPGPQVSQPPATTPTAVLSPGPQVSQPPATTPTAGLMQPPAQSPMMSPWAGLMRQASNNAFSPVALNQTMQNPFSGLMNSLQSRLPWGGMTGRGQSQQGKQAPWGYRGGRSGLGFAPGGGVDGEDVVAMDLPISVGLSGNAFEDRFSPVYDVAPNYKKPETMDLRRGLIEKGYNDPERKEPVTAPEYPDEFFNPKLDRDKPTSLAYAPANSDFGVGRSDLPASITEEARLRGVGTIARPAGVVAVAPQRRAVPGVAGEGRSSGLLGGLFNLSDEARQGLISTGLAMMANRRGGKGSFLAALGEGGQEGVTTYADAMAKTAAARLQAQKQAQELRKEAFEREKFDRPYREMTAVEKARQAREPWQIGPDGKMIPTPGGPHDPKTIRSEAEARKVATVMEDEDARDLAKRYVVSGNRMLMSGLGFGDIGSQNRAKVNRMIREERVARGMSEEQLANLEAEWEGRKSAARTLGTTEARMGTAAFEAKGAINLAREAINNVPRTSFLPVNKLIEGFKNNTLDPNQRELAIRTQGIINAYSAVMARGANVVTDSARHKAESLISSADNPASYNRALDTLMSEIDMAIAAPEKMREHFRKTYGDKSIKHGDDAAPKAEPKAASQEVPKGSIPGTKGGKKVWKTPDGQFIPRE